MASNLFERLKDDLEDGLPIALATIINGSGQGKKLLLLSDGSTLGSLGGDTLNRVLTRDMAGELAAGRTSIRHYGPKGEAREEALSILKESQLPLVVKADGLAAGKGVTVADTIYETKDAVRAAFQGKFGFAGETLVLEEKLNGPEVSIFALCDIVSVSH